VVAGRVANRIGNAAFTFNGKHYQLEANQGSCHLHGGNRGFDKQLWEVKSVTQDKIVFSHTSPDGDSGYPGDLTAIVMYTITNDNALRIDYEVFTGSETVCNLTNHSYFNLDGYDAATIYPQEIEICADRVTAVDDMLVPTGAFMDVANTPLDLRTVKRIGDVIDAAGKVNDTGGFDHNYVLRAKGKAASVYSPNTGIRMTVYTNSPGVQFYTGNFLDGSVTGKGVTFGKHSGFCLETQLFPDAVNHPEFPSCVVTREKPKTFYTEYRFEW